MLKYLLGYNSHLAFIYGKMNGMQFPLYMWQLHDSNQYTVYGNRLRSTRISQKKYHTFIELLFIYVVLNTQYTSYVIKLINHHLGNCIIFAVT